MRVGTVETACAGVRQTEQATRDKSNAKMRAGTAETAHVGIRKTPKSLRDEHQTIRDKPIAKTACRHS